MPPKNQIKKVFQLKSATFCQRLGTFTTPPINTHIDIIGVKLLSESPRLFGDTVLWHYHCYDCPATRAMRSWPGPSLLSLLTRLWTVNIAKHNPHFMVCKGGMLLTAQWDLKQLHLNTRPSENTQKFQLWAENVATMFQKTQKAYTTTRTCLSFQKSRFFITAILPIVSHSAVWRRGQQLRGLIRELIVRTRLWRDNSASHKPVNIMRH